MKVLFVSFLVGLFVGVLYGVIRVKSPAAAHCGSARSSGNGVRGATRWLDSCKKDQSHTRCFGLLVGKHWDQPAGCAISCAAPASRGLRRTKQLSRRLAGPFAIPASEQEEHAMQRSRALGAMFFGIVVLVAGGGLSSWQHSFPVAAQAIATTPNCSGRTAVRYDPRLRCTARL